MSSKSDCDWRVAQDPKTGREYYYNRITKETTWTKPMELASEEERTEMERKKAEARKFFDEMEQNIRRKADPSYRPKEVVEVPASEMFDWDELGELPDPSQMVRRGSIGGIRLQRTISSIDDDIMEMMKREDSEKSPTGRQKRSESKSSRDSKTISDLKDELTSVPRTTIKRRNSTGTIYVDTTMSAQDNQATIRCVCAVIRAHMVEAETERIVPRPQFDTFKDPDFESDERNAETLEEKEERMAVPSLDLVVKFFHNAYSKSQMESECIIMTLIYIERLIKVTKGRFCIRYDNWKPTVFACMILASKVWDDLSMWNVDFSQISPAFDLQRINELELALLEALHYEVKVPAGEYAKYYFHLRSMIARLGFLEKDGKSQLPGRILPLSVEGARRLQLATETYEELKLNQTETRPRCVSIHTETPAKIQLQRMQSTGDATDLQRTVAVALEQLIHQQHIHGDGGSATKARTGRRISDLSGSKK